MQVTLPEISADSAGLSVEIHQVYDAQDVDPKTKRHRGGTVMDITLVHHHATPPGETPPVRRIGPMRVGLYATEVTPKLLAAAREMLDAQLAHASECDDAARAMLDAMHTAGVAMDAHQSVIASCTDAEKLTALHAHTRTLVMQHRAELAPFEKAHDAARAEADVATKRFLATLLDHSKVRRELGLE